MFTDINKHGTTIYNGMQIMGEGFMIGSKSIVGGTGVILLSYGAGLASILDGVGHIFYDALLAMPKTAVWK